MADNIKIQLQDIYEPVTTSDVNKAKKYVLRREQAANALAMLVDALLDDAAGEITRICYKYGVNPTAFTISSSYNEKMMEEVAEVMDKLEEDILELIGDYSTICTTDKEKKRLLLLWVLALGKNNQGLQQTIHQRLRMFLRDLEAMIAAAKTAKFDVTKAVTIIKGNIRTAYQMPGMLEAFAKASLYEAEYIRSRGVKHGYRGSSNSETNNINRMAKTTLQMAWMHQQRLNYEEQGAAGFYVLRGSSYYCTLCDSKCGFHQIDEIDAYPPFHSSCCCLAIPIFEKDIKQLTL